MSSSSGTTSAASSPSSDGARAARLLARLGHALFRLRDVLFPVVLLIIAFGTRPRLAGGDIHLDHALDVIGFLVSLSGQVLRALVIGLVYITRGGQNRQVWANALVEGGMFAHSRNPLYVGNLLIILGLAIVHNGWAMYLVAVPTFGLVYSAIVSAEEEYLRGRFGQAYVDYCRRVPRWLPSLHGLRQTLGSGTFDWLKVLRKEYGTPFAWITGFLVLLVWEHQGPSAKATTATEMRVIVVVWIALALAWAVARTLKLRGYIGTG
jgi:protein-S-isoprenylcysteine O-methyltransferase Ste14